MDNFVMLNAAPAAASKFEPIKLPGPDYIAGPAFFPANVIAGYHADHDQYDSDTWAKHMVEQGEKFSACTLVTSWAAINSGTPKVKYWFGYLYRGRQATAKDFVQNLGVEDAQAFTRN